MRCGRWVTGSRAGDAVAGGTSECRRDEVPWSSPGMTYVVGRG